MHDDLDYYAYKPLVHPDRPVCLVGLPGSRADQIARMVSLLTGLPLFQVDRAVEHKAGRTIDGVMIQEGRAARLAWERQVLPPVLKRPTPHVIALSDSTLLDPALADLVRATTRLVHVVRPRQALVSEMARQNARNRGAFARLLLACPAEADRLEPAFAPLEAPMRNAEHVLDVGELHPQRAADLVIDALGWTIPNLWTRSD